MEILDTRADYHVIVENVHKFAIKMFCNFVRVTALARDLS